MRKPINQSNYKIKVVADLGMKTTKTNRIPQRTIVLECPICFSQFETTDSNGRKKIACKSCSKKIANAKKRKPIDTSNFKMEFIKDIRHIRKGYYVMACTTCKKHVEIRMDAVDRGQENCNDCSISHKSTMNGLSTTSKLYPIWNGIMQRCYDSKRKDYHRYGGAGVFVSEDFHDFLAFYEFCTTNGWEDGLHVDKDKKCTEQGLVPHRYSPDTISFILPSENCRLASGKAIKQFDLNGTYLNQFGSAIEAAESIGIKSGDNITSACRGRIKTSSGYIWKYAPTQN